MNEKPKLLDDQGRDSVSRNRFRLIRYFMVTSLVAFAAVAAALYVFQATALSFFKQVQSDQRGFLAGLQLELSQRQEHAARESLLRVHQAAHVNTTRLFENVLWREAIEPLLVPARSLSIERCRAMAGSGTAIDAHNGSDARRQCHADLGKRIMASPGFARADARMYASLRKTTAFKIKVYDLRGLTVYSSEHRQIGEDKAGNRGWMLAAAGTSASELTHRDRFSAFEGMVENRDLISSYVPVRAPGSDKVVAVFEIYSDVTPFLARIAGTTAEIAGFNAAIRDSVARAAESNQREVDAGSNRQLAVVGALLTLLYVALLLLVRNAQRIIDRQAREQESAVRREALWHREKMAALATMAANVAHEVGNPLATISALAEEMVEQQRQSGCPVYQPREIIARARRIAAMTREIADFAATRSDSPELVDLNHMVKAMCDFMSFDHRFRITRIEFQPGVGLPGCMVVADRLNEILMTLLHGSVEGGSGHAPPPSRLIVQTAMRDDRMLVRIACELAAQGGVVPPVLVAPSSPELTSRRRHAVAERLAAGMGAQLLQSGSTVELVLPPEPPQSIREGVSLGE